MPYSPRNANGSLNIPDDKSPTAFDDWAAFYAYMSQPANWRPNDEAELAREGLDLSDITLNSPYQDRVSTEGTAYLDTPPIANRVVAPAVKAESPKTAARTEPGTMQTILDWWRARYPAPPTVPLGTAWRDLQGTLRVGPTSPAVPQRGARSFLPATVETLAQLMSPYNVAAGAVTDTAPVARAPSGQDTGMAPPFDASSAWNREDMGNWPPPGAGLTMPPPIDAAQPAVATPWTPPWSREDMGNLPRAGMPGLSPAASGDSTPETPSRETSAWRPPWNADAMGNLPVTPDIGRADPGPRAHFAPDTGAGPWSPSYGAPDGAPAMPSGPAWTSPLWQTDAMGNHPSAPSALPVYSPPDMGAGPWSPSYGAGVGARRDAPAVAQGAQPAAIPSPSQIASPTSQTAALLANQPTQSDVDTVLNKYLGKGPDTNVMGALDELKTRGLSSSAAIQAIASWTAPMVNTVMGPQQLGYYRPGFTGAPQKPARPKLI